MTAPQSLPRGARSWALRTAPVLIVVLAGCTGLSDDGAPATTWTPGDPVPSLDVQAMDFGDDEAGLQWSVMGVSDGPLPRSDVRIGYYACTWETTTGAVVSVGDTLHCTSDDILTLIHIPSGQTVFSNCGGCTQLAPDDDDDGSPSSGSQPAISWQVSQSQATATVTAADPGADWSEFEVRFDRSGELAGDAVASTTTMPAGTYVQLDGGSIGGGDTLHFCVSGQAGPLEATLRHIDSGNVAREFTYNQAHACA